MLTLRQKHAICNLVQDEIERDPPSKSQWLPILATIAKDIRTHTIAIQRAAKRNQLKQSRRTQRGPHLTNKTKFDRDTNSG